MFHHITLIYNFFKKRYLATLVLQELLKERCESIYIFNRMNIFGTKIKEMSIIHLKDMAYDITANSVDYIFLCHVNNNSSKHYNISPLKRTTKNAFLNYCLP